MRNLLLTLIVASLIPIQTLATDLDQCRTDCKAALDSAEVVIDKQNQLIDIIKSRNDNLFKEKSSLEVDLQNVQQAKETAQEHEILWGLIGAVVGGIAGAYLIGRAK